MSKVCVCCDEGATMKPFTGETHQIEYRGHVDLVHDALSGVHFLCGAVGLK